VDLVAKPPSGGTNDSAVRLYSRNANDLTARRPAIACRCGAGQGQELQGQELHDRQQAVVLGRDGLSSPSRRHASRGPLQNISKTRGMGSAKPGPGARELPQREKRERRDEAPRGFAVGELPDQITSFSCRVNLARQSAMLHMAPIELGPDDLASSRTPRRTDDFPPNSNKPAALGARPQYPRTERRAI